MAAVPNFDPIAPNAIDRVAFDFTAEIGDNGVINGVSWICDAAIDSPVVDPSSSSRIISVDQFTDYKTSALIGTMVDGVIYQLQVLVNISDGRVLPQTAGILCIAEVLPDLPAQPIDSQVFFNYQLWLTRYPEFTYVPELTALQYFTDATLYWRNDGTGPVTNNAQQLSILNLLTSHIAMLYNASSSMASSPFIGPITNVSEGSVSIGSQAPTLPGSAAWFALTRYGFAFWLATAAFRTMRYRPGYPRRFEPSYFKPYLPE